MQWGVTKVLTQGGRRGALRRLHKRKEREERVRPELESLKPKLALDVRRIEGELCPRQMFLGISNSMATEDDSICRVSIFSPYWVDNRTGFDLVFKDLDVPAIFNSLPFLLYDPVRAPGQPRSQRLLPTLEAVVGQVLRKGSSGRSGSSSTARIPSPALLNEQGSTCFKLQDAVGETGWSETFKIQSAGQKFDIVLRGSQVVGPLPDAPASLSTCPDLLPAPNSPAAAQGLTTCSAPASTAAAAAVLSTATAATAGHEGPPGPSSLEGVHPTHPAAPPRPWVGLAKHPVDASTADCSLASSPFYPAHLPPLPAPGAQLDRCMELSFRPDEAHQSLPSHPHGPSNAVAVSGLQQRIPVLDTLPTGQPGLSFTLRSQRSSDPTPATGPGTPRAALSFTPEEQRPSRPSRPSNTSLAAIPSAVPPGPDASGAPSSSTQPPAQAATTGPAVLRRSAPTVRLVQRSYHFAVEIWPGPSDTPFRLTKVLTVKNKYIILNDTGLSMEFKQKGTPDPGLAYGAFKRFAGELPAGRRVALHWDNAHLEQQLVIRPMGGDWQWSGSFRLPEREDYFGLRIRHRSGSYVIIPVNITVGRAGSVLVTLKSDKSVPPYMILNRCKDVVIRLKQSGGQPRAAPGTFQTHSVWDSFDEVQPNAGKPMPFAWDEPNGQHTVLVLAHAVGVDVRSLNVQDTHGIALDEITEDVTEVHVQQARRDTQTCDPRELSATSNSSTANMYAQPRSSLALYSHAAYTSLGSQDAAGREARERMDRMARVLAKECAKKVYVSVYAEGPTRVLCFAEDKATISSVDDQGSLMSLALRLQQIAIRMAEVDDELGRHLGSGDRGALPRAADMQPGLPPSPKPTPSLTATSSHPALFREGGDTQAAAKQQQQQQQQQQQGTQPQPTHAGHMSREASGLTLASNSGGNAGGGSQAREGQQDPGPGSGHALGTSGSGLQAGAPPGSGSGSGPGLGLKGTLPRLAMLRAPSRSHWAGSAASSSNLQALSGPGGGRGAAGASPRVNPPSSDALLGTGAWGGTGGTSWVQSGQSADECPGQQLAVRSGGPQQPSGLEVAIGGDLRVRLISARNLPPPDRADMHIYAQVKVKGLLAATSIIPYTTTAPSWQFEESFRDVAASSELVVEVWGLAGSQRVKDKASTLAADTGPAGATFLGCVEVPLQETLPAGAAVGGGPVPLTLEDSRWCPLKRRVGNQVVSGELLMAVEWQFTMEGLLQREVQLLEHMLAQKVELVARLAPVAPQSSLAWLQLPDLPSLDRSAGGAGAAGCSGEPGQGQGQQARSAPEGIAEVDNRSGTGGVSSLGASQGGALCAGLTLQPVPGHTLGGADEQGGRAEGVLALGAEDDGEQSLQDAQQISESYFINLDVSVLEVRNLAPRGGWQHDLVDALGGLQPLSAQQRSLPLAQVQLACFDTLHAVTAPQPSLNPRFEKNSCRFENITLGNAISIKVGWGATAQRSR
ncbi:hypothetical protein V8C86DRAFT_613892 [Haematococcus lacustris]